MKSALIAINKNNEYIVCTKEGSMLAGPFLNNETAVSERLKLGLASAVDRGLITISESKTKGFEGYLIVIDNVPYTRFKLREDAEKILTAFERGIVSLIYKRFLGGLGDLIAVSGAAVMLAKMYGQISLTSTNKYQDEFKKIFINYPDITLDVAFQDVHEFVDMEIEENLLLHNASVSIRDTHMDSFERVYYHFKIPYRYRWEACPVAAACKNVDQCEVPEKPYVFLHDDPARGYVIDRTRLPKVPIFHSDSVINDSVLSFKDVIENAEQVHVFDSVFFHLAESLEPKGSLHFHRYVRAHQKRYKDYKTKYKWEILT